MTEPRHWDRFTCMTTGQGSWYLIYVYDEQISDWVESQRFGSYQLVPDDAQMELRPLTDFAGKQRWRILKQSQLFSMQQYLVDQHVYNMLILKYGVND